LQEGERGAHGIGVLVNQVARTGGWDHVSTEDVGGLEIVNLKRGKKGQSNSHLKEWAKEETSCPVIFTLGAKKQGGLARPRFLGKEWGMV